MDNVPDSIDGAQPPAPDSAAWWRDVAATLGAQLFLAMETLREIQHNAPSVAYDNHVPNVLDRIAANGVPADALRESVYTSLRSQLAAAVAEGERLTADVERYVALAATWRHQRIEARAAALEEAAKECDGVAFFYADPVDGQDRDIVRGAKYSAQRIRALSAKDAGPKGEGSK